MHQVAAYIITDKLLTEGESMWSLGWLERLKKLIENTTTKFIFKRVF